MILSVSLLSAVAKVVTLNLASLQGPVEAYHATNCEPISLVLNILDISKKL
jgi:hypothetical protein